MELKLMDHQHHVGQLDTLDYVPVHDLRGDLKINKAPQGLG